MSGWVKFHRKIEEWEWYKDANTFRVFFHLVLMANHDEKRWQGIVIQRGQVVTSRDSLAAALNLSVREIRTALTKLKTTGELTIKTTSRYSLVTVENYSAYQSTEIETTSKTTNKTTVKRPTSDQQTTTNKNEKNYKNEKNKRNTDSELAEILEPQSKLDYTLVDFIEHRKEIKKPMTKRALTLMISKLDKMAVTEEERIAILNQSIVNRWQDIYELKGNKGYGGKKPQTIGDKVKDALSDPEFIAFLNDSPRSD